MMVSESTKRIFIINFVQETRLERTGVFTVKHYNNDRKRGQDFRLRSFTLAAHGLGLSRMHEEIGMLDPVMNERLKFQALNQQKRRPKWRLFYWRRLRNEVRTYFTVNTQPIPMMIPS